MSFSEKLSRGESQFSTKTEREVPVCFVCVGRRLYIKPEAVATSGKCFSIALETLRDARNMLRIVQKSARSEDIRKDRHDTTPGSTARRWSSPYYERETQVVLMKRRSPAHVTSQTLATSLLGKSVSGSDGDDGDGVWRTSGALRHCGRATRDLPKQSLAFGSPVAEIRAARDL